MFTGTLFYGPQCVLKIIKTGLFFSKFFKNKKESTLRKRHTGILDLVWFHSK